jgi:hypothetical protein
MTKSELPGSKPERESLKETLLRLKQLMISALFQPQPGLESALVTSDDIMRSAFGDEYINKRKQLVALGNQEVIEAYDATHQADLVVLYLKVVREKGVHLAKPFREMVFAMPNTSLHHVGIELRNLLEPETSQVISDQAGIEREPYDIVLNQVFITSSRAVAEHYAAQGKPNTSIEVKLHFLNRLLQLGQTDSNRALGLQYGSNEHNDYAGTIVSDICVEQLRQDVNQ